MKTYTLTADFEAFTGRVRFGAPDMLTAFCKATDRLPIINTANRITLEAT